MPDRMITIILASDLYSEEHRVDWLQGAGQ